MKDKGFSLIEVSLTLVLTGILLGGLLGIFQEGFNIGKKLKEQSMAQNLAREVMEAYADWNTLSSFGVPGTYYNSFVMAGYPLPLNNVTYNLTLDTSDAAVFPGELIQYRVTISWGTQSFSLTSFKGNY